MFTAFNLLYSPGIKFAIARGKEEWLDFSSVSDLRVVKTKTDTVCGEALSHILLIKKYMAEKCNGFGEEERQQSL